MKYESDAAEASQGLQKEENPEQGQGQNEHDIGMAQNRDLNPGWCSRCHPFPIQESPSRSATVASQGCVSEILVYRARIFRFPQIDLASEISETRNIRGSRVDLMSEISYTRIFRYP